MDREKCADGSSDVALLEALQAIALWSGSARVKWYVDQYANSLIAERQHEKAAADPLQPLADVVRGLYDSLQAGQIRKD